MKQFMSFNVVKVVGHSHKVVIILSSVCDISEIDRWLRRYIFTTKESVLRITRIINDIRKIDFWLRGDHLYDFRKMQTNWGMTQMITFTCVPDHGRHITQS